MKFNQVQIIDYTGKTIKSTSIMSKTIDVADLPNGIYFLKLKTNSGVVHSRFVKE